MILLFADNFTTGGTSLYGRTSTSGGAWVAPSADQGGVIVNSSPTIGLNSSGYTWGVSPDPSKSINAEVPSIQIDTSKPIKMEVDIFYDGNYIYESIRTLPLGVRLSAGFSGSPLFTYALRVEAADSAIDSKFAFNDSAYFTQLGENPNVESPSTAPMVRTTLKAEWDGVSGLSIIVNGQTPITANYSFAVPSISPYIYGNNDGQSGIIIENFKMYGTIYEATAPTFWKDKIKCREVT